MAGGERLKEPRVVGVTRKKADERKHRCRMDGGGDVRAGGGAHPGANAGPMHAGIVVRRMLEFMRHRAAGRHGQ